VRVILGKVTGVDSKRRTAIIEGGTLDERRITYDYLVLATGARHSYFGRDEWEGVAPGLKKVDDATGIRRRILTVFAPPGDGCSSTRRPVRICRRFKTQETFALR
jgi:NADH:ubiquinone reductase (H+-translocating)